MAQNTWEKFFIQGQHVGFRHIVEDGNTWSQLFAFEIDGHFSHAKSQINYSPGEFPRWKTYSLHNEDASFEAHNGNEAMGVSINENSAVQFDSTDLAFPEFAKPLLIRSLKLKKGAYLEFDKIEDIEPSSHVRTQFYCKGKEKIEVSGKKHSTFYVVEFVNKEVQNEFWLDDNHQVLKQVSLGAEFTIENSKDDALAGLSEQVIQFANA